jgi:hypothetical protein
VTKGSKRIYLAVFSDTRVAINHDMGFQLACIAERHMLTNHTIRANFDIGADGRVFVHYGRGVYIRHG